MSYRELISRFTRLFGVNAVSRVRFRRRLLVLCYHGVCGEESDVWDPAGMHVPARQFEAQLCALLRYYVPVTLRQVMDKYLKGVDLPDRALLLTFDDGYRNVLRHGLPILHRLGVPAVLFPPAGLVERGSWLWDAVFSAHFRQNQRYSEMKRWLTRLPAVDRRRWLQEQVSTDKKGPACDHTLYDWNELRDAINTFNLVEIGSHGLNHEPLTTCSPEEIVAELRGSRQLLKERLGVEAEAFAYPKGDWSPAVVEAARAAGYVLAFTTEPRHARGVDDCLALPRILTGASDTPAQLMFRIAGHLEWLQRM